MRLVRALVIVNCVSIHVLPGTRPSRQTTQQTTREIFGLKLGKEFKDLFEPEA
jgi:hypothetical protein